MRIEQITQKSDFAVGYMRCEFIMKLAKSTFTMCVKYNVIGDMTSPCRDE